VARGLFRASDWESHRDLGFALYLESAESAFQSEDFEGALRLLDAIDHPSLAPIDFARVAVQRIQVYAVTWSAEACLDYVLGALRRVGLRWPVHPSRLRVELALRAVQWRMRGRDGADLLRKASSLAPRAVAAILLIGRGGSVMARVDVRLLALASSWVMACYLRHGYLARPGFSISSYAIHRPWSPRSSGSGGPVAPSAGLRPAARCLRRSDSGAHLAGAIASSRRATSPAGMTPL
jgi:hypothetical protein